MIVMALLLGTGLVGCDPEEETNGATEAQEENGTTDGADAGTAPGNEDDLCDCHCLVDPNAPIVVAARIDCNESGNHCDGFDGAPGNWVCPELAEAIELPPGEPAPEETPDGTEMIPPVADPDTTVVAPLPMCACECDAGDDIVWEYTGYCSEDGGSCTIFNGNSLYGGTARCVPLDESLAYETSLSL